MLHAPLLRQWLAKCPPPPPNLLWPVCHVGGMSSPRQDLEGGFSLLTEKQNTLPTREWQPLLKINLPMFSNYTGTNSILSLCHVTIKLWISKLNIDCVCLFSPFSTKIVTFVFNISYLTHGFIENNQINQIMMINSGVRICYDAFF